MFWRMRRANFLGFEIQTDNLISVRRPDLLIRRPVKPRSKIKRTQKKKKTDLNLNPDR